MSIRAVTQSIHREECCVTATIPPTTAISSRAVQATQDLRKRRGRDRSACARRRRRHVRARRVLGDHGPVGHREVDAAALHRRPRQPHERPSVPRRHRDQRAVGERAHAAAPRPHRVRVPGVQPHPHAHRDGEHHAAARAGGPPSPIRSGSSTSSTSSACDLGSATGRRSSRAASSSASRSRARSRASPRSCSPTSPPATSTPGERRDPRLHEARGARSSARRS